uniref:Uncharacterized protein n=1 Tax=Eutreptiella gymnastica TaxID=73025 RepID=A0A7S1NIQ5_9EUGL|mmetsp:Transcript_44067/g.79141  ORF Transcript_44067/g.79141 Transcript_44067/m.79141 type:complete len:224 (+) Transcript_44067:444-1115(+)
MGALSRMTSKGSGFLGAGERAPCVTGHEGALHADRLVNKSSAQAGQTMIQAVWEASKGRPRSVGPVGRACRTVTNLGWRAIDRWWKWQLPDDPEPLDMVCEPVSKLMHRVQEALREQQLRQLELRRPRQFEGMKGEVLKDVLNKQLVNYPDGVERALLLGAIAGATWTADTAHRRGLRTTAQCLYCEDGTNEDEDHLFWKCNVWQVVRDPMVAQLIQLTKETP